MSIKHEVTIYDIATALDISPSTVSRALSGIPRVRKDTRDKILNTARQLGYRQNYFASRLRSQHTKLLGAIVPTLDTVASALIAEAESVARLNQYSLILTQSKNEEGTYRSIMKQLSDCRVEGILVYNIPSGAANQKAVYSRLPAVVIEKIALPAGGKTDADTGFKLTTHLLGRGCKNILVVSASPEVTLAAQVTTGYQAAIGKADWRHQPNFASYTIRQTAGGLRKYIGASPVKPDGVLYIGPVIAALSVSQEAPQGHAFDKDGHDDVPASSANTCSALGNFAMQLLLALVEEMETHT